MTAPEGTELRVDGPADLGWLDEIHTAFARLWGRAPGVAALDRTRFETAVIEVATNIARHGRTADGSPVHAGLLMRVLPDALEAEFADTGVPARVDLDPAPVDDLALGGRGIALVQRAVDTLSLSYRDGHNIWWLVRRRVG
ncbi:ATP-binding protein [Cellulomonas denverensis]|uniref:ATP-binding protein n=1 Tax=Cellulomonas denverensis TaxID=264297 RepID=A0A7X6KSU1_9CELL|nr:ATP-binding protein [Cellulomonas denverensis]NKY21513.1 ATP-binding protein [Cellulomonas denverensis]GIG27027.1 hypothetical protein Cde04nite_32710 [Cellulomonas denverensis]